MQITTEKRKRKIFPETALLRARQISRKVARRITYKGVLFEKQSNKRIHYKSHKTIHIPAHWPGLFPTEIRWLFANNCGWSMCALKSLIYWMPAPYTVKSSDLIHDPVHIYIYTLGWSSFPGPFSQMPIHDIQIIAFQYTFPHTTHAFLPRRSVDYSQTLTDVSMCALKSFICLIIAPYTVKSSDLIHDPVPIYIYIYTLGWSSFLGPFSSQMPIHGIQIISTTTVSAAKFRGGKLPALFSYTPHYIRAPYFSLIILHKKTK